MAMIKGVGDFFGLDISMSAVRVVQLSPAGAGRWSLQHYGYAPIDIKTAMADSAEARNRLGEVIMTVVGQSGIKTKDVAIGLSANKTFITVIDVPNANSQAEFDSSIKYQLDQYIPTDVNEAKVDWKPLGPSPSDPTRQEVLIASTTVSYAEDRLELVESLGFDVIAAEPDPLAMIRSVLKPGSKDAQMIVDMGEQSINVAITFGDMPRLVRTIPNGLSTLSNTAVHHLGVSDEQARQFIFKFGLAQDKLEGKVVRALDSTLEGILSELSKSIKFFQTRYQNIPISEVLLVGYASMIPQMPEYVAAKTGIKTSVANPWQFVSGPNNDARLNAVAGEFAVAVGLAQRGGLL
ncbi:MAG: type pilus assembly protein PilM [Patescibacteria group bacterium]|nr:type pilus assembly protein PilM [Patescibacteria group bacterium]